MKLKDFPEIKTQRLHLKLMSLQDIDITFALRSNKEVRQYIEKPLFTTTEEARMHVKKVMSLLDTNEAIGWIIYIKDETVKVGEICLWNFSKDRKTAETGYSLLPEYFNKGYMSEALQAVINFGFNSLDLKTIEAYTHEENEASKKLLRKNKFVLQENRKDQDFPKNAIYTLDK